MRKSSLLALLFVLITVGGSFIWWVKYRPSYLLFQAHRQMKNGNAAGIIHQYKNLLKNPNLEKEEEIRLRKALGHFYLSAVQEKQEFSLYLKDDYGTNHPYLAAAKSEWEKVLDQDKTDGMAHYALGRIFLIQKLEPYAIEELKKSVKTLPNKAEPLRILSLIHLERGEGSQALEFALQSVAADPLDDLARSALISAYFSVGNSDKAIREYSNLSDHFLSEPDNRSRYAYHLARENYWKEAEDELKKVVTSDISGDTALHLGDIFLLQRRYDDAAGQFSQAADLLPHSLWPVIKHAEANSFRGKCEEPIRIGGGLVERFPRWAWSHYLNARGLLCRENENAALDELEESLRLSRDFSEAQILKARILLDKGMYEELGSHLRPWLDRNVNQGDAYALLSESLYLQNKPDLCMETADLALKSRPRDEKVRVWLGLAKNQLGDVEGAIRELKRAAELNPFNPMIEGAYAIVQASTIGGERYLDTLEMDPENAELNYFIGEAFIQRKDYSRAVDAYQRSISQKPYFLRSYIGLLRALDVTGDTVRMEAVLSQAFAVNPRSSEINQWRTKRRSRG